MSHAILSPSSSARWLKCTPSARAEESIPNVETSFAREGTLAHALCEALLKAYRESDAIAAYDADQLAEAINEDIFAEARKVMSTMDDEGYDSSEGLECAALYSQAVYSDYLEAKKLFPDNSELFVEAPLRLELFVPQSFGTVDSAIISGSTLKVYDFKYGRGVKVSADRNSQMMLYALGTLFGPGEPYDIKFVEMTIIQPRKRNYSTWNIGADELTDWGWTSLAPVAKVAFLGEGKYVPGEHCHFCRVASRCRALAESVAVTVEQGQQPELMEPEEIAAQLASIDMVENWLKAIKDYSFNYMMEGKEIPGYKVVEGRATSKIADTDKAIEALVNAGFSREDFMKAPELKTQTDLKKLLTPKGFRALLEPLVERTPGKPTIAPVEDPRPVYNQAETAFKNA